MSKHKVRHPPRGKARDEAGAKDVRFDDYDRTFFGLVVVGLCFVLTMLFLVM